MANFEEDAFPTLEYNTWMNMWQAGASDWADGSLRWQFPVNFDKWCYPYFCGGCKRGEICKVPLQRCNGCKMTYYCGRDHQKKAWSGHKLICKHLSNFFESHDSSAISTAAAWKKHVFYGIGTLRMAANQVDPFSVTMNEEEWLNQRHCQACFYNPADTKVLARTLVECSTCHCVAHCSSPSCTERFAALHTRTACEQYMIGFASIVMSMQQGNMLIINCNTRAKTVSLPTDWNDYFTRKIEDFDVAKQLIAMPPVMAMLTDGLSIPLTILRGLLLTYGAAHLLGMARLEVHLLGAEIAEVNGLASKAEEILHWLPACKELVLKLVFGNGELFKAISPSLLSKGAADLTLCTGCTTSRAKVTLLPVAGFYHDLVQAGTLSPSTADIVLASHSGMHDFQGSPGKPAFLTVTWEPTVRLLATTNVPCIFTGYNAQETTGDRGMLLAWGAKVVVDQHLNPFRGLRPFPEVGEDNKFYYSNHSCIITRGGTSKP